MPGSPLRIGHCGRRLVGGLLGYLVFRYGLRGAYFALVTLAFAEVVRIIACVVPITGGGFGMLIPLAQRPRTFQFATARLSI